MRTKKKNAAALPGETHPPVPFSVFAEYMETLANMVVSGGPIESPDCCNIGGFICNHGTAEEMAEALLGIMPVATRVYLRYEPANNALLAESPAAVKGKKK
jgi:hypothetical protein